MKSTTIFGNLPFSISFFLYLFSWTVVKTFQQQQQKQLQMKTDGVWAFIFDWFHCGLVVVNSITCSLNYVKCLYLKGLDFGDQKSISENFELGTLCSGPLLLSSMTIDSKAI